MDESASEPEQQHKSRTLQIEKDGDFCKGKIRPMIRLKGRWLEQAGFLPGQRVSVRQVATGIIELRSTSGTAS